MSGLAKEIAEAVDDHRVPARLGAERPVIVIADVPAGGVSELGTRMHIALTRALTAVRVVAPAGDASGEWPGLGA